MAKKKAAPQAPPAPEPIDFGTLLANANAAGTLSVSSMAAAQSDAYASMLEQALAATDQIAAKLDNSYTHRAANILDDTATEITSLRATGGKISALGDAALRDIEGTAIENTLAERAKSDLALGRSLSPEEIRASQQSSRTAFSARGMGTGAPAASYEILNRDALATSREDSRRAFASSVNQMQESNRMGRLSAAASAYGASGEVATKTAGLNLGRASAYVSTDPYQRALASNLPGQILNSSSALTDAAYSRGFDLAPAAANYNGNMRGNIYNSWQNNQAALQGAKLQADASGAAGNSALLSAGIGAAGSAASAAASACCCWVARAAFGEQSPEWKRFRSWLLRRAPQWFRHRYMRYGERIAPWIAAHPIARFLTRIFMRSILATQ